MKYTVSIGSIIALGIVLFAGCAAQGLKIQNADIAYDEGRVDEALKLYLEVLENKPDGKYADYGHFQVAEIYKDRGEWDEALQHYQAIVDRSTTGYLSGRARSRISDIRKSSEIIAQEKFIYDNNSGTEQGKTKAALALLNIGDAYYTLGNYPEAIRYYKKFVAEFPDHERAPQTQFKVGSTYFYKLYDYQTGWPEFTKLFEDEQFKDTFEAKEAVTLLKKVKLALDGIKQDMDYIAKYRRETAMEYEKLKRYVSQFEKYSVYAEQIAQTYRSIARAWENDPLRNYPNAIKTYQELADELPQEKSAVAEALFKVGELSQVDGQYERALRAYEELFERSPESSWRDKAVYNQARCYEAIREFTKAYNRYKDYMSLGKDKEFYRAADQKVRQYEYDQDGDGYPFYKEQEAGTSDEDPNVYPGSQDVQVSK